MTCYFPIILLLTLLPAVLCQRTPDFIIVGGGTAGCALAARLCTALPRATITLLERGPERTNADSVNASAPRLAVFLDNFPRFAERFETEPNPSLLGRKLEVLTGATLGGTSVLNGLQWNEPPQAAENWGVRGLDAAQSRILFDRAFAQLKVAVPPKELRHSLYKEWIVAAGKAGLPELKRPFKGKRNDGVYYNRVAVDGKARRQDSYAGYLAPELKSACKDRVNVIQGATVRQIIVSRRKRKPFGGFCDTPRDTTSCRCQNIPPLANAKFVRGVRYVLDGDKKTTLTLRARREVLITAGPLGSPKLLQLSGIGPRKLLRKLRITVRADVPVGRRAQGKALSGVLTLFRGRSLGPENDPALIYSREAREQFLRGDGGPLGVSLVALNGFYKKTALLEMLQVGTVPQLFGNPIILSLCLQNPTSFGTLEIRGKDPFLSPKADLNFLSSQQEIDALLACTMKLRDINANLDPTIQATEVMPGAAALNETYIRATAINAYHLVGGCAVGSVTESDLRVKGFDNLRVIDSSSIPVMPPLSGPMASVYVLAEHAAELISDEYGCTNLGRPLR